MAGEQDGGTVDKSRFDGLMSSYSKAQAENAALKAQLAGQSGGGGVPDLGAQDSGGDSFLGDSQQTEATFEEGETYTFEGGQFVPFEAPTPGRHNESRTRNQSGRDDGSAAWLEGQLDKANAASGGKPPAWPV